jgi:hypothetical protein
MPHYINPKDKTKLEWLKEHGEETVWCTRLVSVPEGFTAVCLINSFRSEAALVISSQEELDQLNDGIDCRPKRWFYVLTEDLRKA